MIHNASLELYYILHCLWLLKDKNVVPQYIVVAFFAVYIWFKINYNITKIKPKCMMQCHRGINYQHY